MSAGLPPRPRARSVITQRMVSWSVLGGVVLLVVLVGIAWRASNPVWFLFFPVLLIGVVAATAMAVLWGLRQF